MSNAPPNGSNKTTLWVLGFFVTALMGAAPIPTHFSKARWSASPCWSSAITT